MCVMELYTYTHMNDMFASCSVPLLCRQSKERVRVCDCELHAPRCRHTHDLLAHAVFCSFLCSQRKEVLQQKDTKPRRQVSRHSSSTQKQRTAEREEMEERKERRRGEERERREREKRREEKKGREREDHRRETNQNGQ